MKSLIFISILLIQAGTTYCQGNDSINKKLWVSLFQNNLQTSDRFLHTPAENIGYFEIKVNKHKIKSIESTYSINDTVKVNYLNLDKFAVYKNYFIKLLKGRNYNKTCLIFPFIVVQTHNGSNSMVHAGNYKIAATNKLFKLLSRLLYKKEYIILDFDFLIIADEDQDINLSVCT